MKPRLAKINKLSFLLTVSSIYQMSIASALLPVLEAELRHQDGDNLMYRAREMDMRVTCGTLFFLHSNFCFRTHMTAHRYLYDLYILN
jgi:hypothetical protein